MTEAKRDRLVDKTDGHERVGYCGNSPNRLIVFCLFARYVGRVEALVSDPESESESNQF